MRKTDAYETALYTEKIFGRDKIRTDIQRDEDWRARLFVYPGCSAYEIANG